LPVDIPIYSVANVDLREAPAATQLESAEYLITVECLCKPMAGMEAFRSLECYLLRQTTKSGKESVNKLRDRFVWELEVERTTEASRRCSSVTTLL